MASMNKPALGDTNWTTPVNDNWTSIENNLIDSSILTTKGDLLSATAASTPARLAVGTDGQALKADSAQSTGLAWADPGLSFSSQDVIDLLWGKKFFSDEGFLPSTKMFEYLGTPPAFAGTAGFGAWTRDPGVMKASGGAIGWYDLGAAKSKILVVVGNFVHLSNHQYCYLTPAVPTGVNPNGYGMAYDWANGPTIIKFVAGAWSRLDVSTGIGPTNWVYPGYAFYFDGGTNKLVLFMRTCGGQWVQAQTATDASYTTLRYVSLQTNAANQRFATPFVCYAQ